MTPSSAVITRRSALRGLAAAMAAPFAWRAHAATPSETLYHASFGAAGMAGADIGSLTASKFLKLVAVAEVDRDRLAGITRRFPDVRVYDDWRVLLDKEKHLDSVNVSTPDHMHAPIAMTALQLGKNVYCQKPLTQTVYEARQLTRVAAEKKVVTQMGIQIHSHPVHKLVVRLIRDGAIGKVREVHSWSGKHWGDTRPRPHRSDPVPPGMHWDLWLGVAAQRPFLRGYYHPAEWRKRMDFGTGTFGDMGCHILDPVFGSLELTAPLTVRSEGPVPNGESWALDSQVNYVYPGTAHTTEKLSLTWYDGNRRPPAEVQQLIGKHQLSDQGSIYLGSQGVLYSPYIADPVLLPAVKFRDFKRPHVDGANHYLQFVEACRGHGHTSAPFSYSGPLSESVLLGCLATRFPKTTLQWDASALKVTNNTDANHHVRKHYRKGWEVHGL